MGGAAERYRAKGAGVRRVRACASRRRRRRRQQQHHHTKVKRLTRPDRLRTRPPPPASGFGEARTGKPRERTRRRVSTSPSRSHSSICRPRGSEREVVTSCPRARILSRRIFPLSWKRMKGGITPSLSVRPAFSPVSSPFPLRARREMGVNLSLSSRRLCPWQRPLPGFPPPATASSIV